MMEKEIRVSIARKSRGLPKSLPAWAIAQYSIGEALPDR
jgi:hypothetical protein